MPHLVSPFVTELIRRVIIQRLPLLNNVFECLNSAGTTFVRHTGVCHTYPDPKDHNAYMSFHYMYAGENNERPYGCHFPPQCPQCFSILSWEKNISGGTQRAHEASQHGDKWSTFKRIAKPANFSQLERGWAVRSWGEHDGDEVDTAQLI